MGMDYWSKEEEKRGAAAVDGDCAGADGAAAAPAVAFA